MPQIERSRDEPALADPGRVWRARPALLLVSLAAWAGLAAADRGLVLPAYCSPAPYPDGEALAGVAAMLRFNPPQALATGWLTMLAATMLPLLAAPLAHVWGGTGGSRARGVGLFLIGYVTVWMAVGAILLLLAMFVNGATSGVSPFAAAAAIALLWQASPWKQACLNRCHDLPDLPSRGADLEALRFGLVHGLSCAGACWALMALPLLAGEAHLAAMALVALFLFAERLAPLRAPAWRLRRPAPSLASAWGELRGRTGEGRAGDEPGSP